MSNITNNKRIVKNTIILYIRMVLVMGVTLFTSRIVLKALGIEDFGIYSVVGGSVAFFTFLSNSMTTALQRFYNYELGKGNKDNVSLYFNQGFWVFVLVSIVIVILSETLGLIILKYYLDIPTSKQQSAFWVFQLSLLSLVFSLLRTPYNALFIAYEKMGYFAILGLVEVFMKLGITYTLLLFTNNRLVIYMGFIALISFVVLEFTIYYCKKTKINEKITFHIDKNIIKKLLSFSSWTTLTAGANILSNQGVNLVLNNVFGVLVSAATGIANQVQSAIMTFLGSFQTAFNPQIVKTYASGEINQLVTLMFRMSLLSFYLMMIVSIPLIIKMQPLLELWLIEVPEWTSIFCICIMLSWMVESYSGPFWMAMQAVGKIRNYQIIGSLCISLTFFGAAILVYSGFSPAWAFIVKIIVTAIVVGIRVGMLRKYIKFSIRQFSIKVVGRSMLVFVLSFSLAWLLASNFYNFGGMILFTAISILISACIIYLIGVDVKLRKKINLIVITKFQNLCLKKSKG